jgi:ATP-dependent helicase HrpA
MAAHQVVIVCGETGSGKTTQLPKIALAMGRGKLNYPPGQGRLIGHTQPRRIAASSVAKRIAEELKTPLGDVVGYKVRFQDRLSRDASVKLMTDGILLAETQTDPLLKAYDTIIIDEAHERSLNIDFLLGYLRQLLPRRPDLKVVITSATIDAERFAEHFASAKGPAPVIMVSGRMFPVEQRYRPFEESREYDLNDAIADARRRALAEPAQRGRHPGVPAGRARNPRGGRPPAQAPGAPAADAQRRGAAAVRAPEPGRAGPHLRRPQRPAHRAGHQRGRDLAHRARHPLRDRRRHRARQALQLSQQGRAAAGGAGVARPRPTSAPAVAAAWPTASASACTTRRTSGRPRFTDPEILRSSLASVILRMKSLHLGNVEEFPSSSRRSGARLPTATSCWPNWARWTTTTSSRPWAATLAKLPLDPRVGRMILEAATAARWTRCW